MKTYLTHATDKVQLKTGAEQIIVRRGLSLWPLAGLSLSLGHCRLRNIHVIPSKHKARVDSGKHGP